MASEDRSSNLLFLLSLSPLMAGCPAGDDTASSETSGTPTTTGPVTTTEDDSTGMPTTTASSMEGTGTGSTTMATTDPDTTEGSEETTEGLVCEGELPPLMGEVDPLCVAFNEQYNECYYDGTLPQECVDLYAAYCQYYLEYAIMEYGEACGTAYLDFYTCLTALTCEELESMEDPCAKQITALDAACAPR
ncbi:hypothetical protein [Paraliomyxa miuraensis]|uniref:hypothetical protein n=1 Tax=Paraliomyxa miuraensis TaxID=376150 RepID=UPI002255792F|nr:hypothetical protein [Paraliomyxa miuraensis]MCX4244245.1 hypothetical protein [Paraliomyxa miuraensis]